MAEKTLKTRIQHKHEPEANWLQATNFIPLAGELIIYDVDETHSKPRFKIGDGVRNPDTGKVEGTNVNDLPFAANTLPIVTEADNGAFLRVINGAWGIATISSAEEVGF